MVRRRRNTGGRTQTTRKHSPKRPSKRRKNVSLKERFLTTAIWGLGLINVALVFSFMSNFFSADSEQPLSMNGPPPVRRITVEVLNACGVQGLANDVTQYLRQQKFDVVSVGNFSGGFNLDKTLIFDRISLDCYNAKKVAEALDIEANQVVPELESSLQLMVTVIIGRDYRELKLSANR
ncbi:LytR C-terminal domain-containing protein [candidate division KSB1 bacterium]|nr:LytR C-terminal domain-containing protein [candidate division KSB1 bacterium]